MKVVAWLTEGTWQACVDAAGAVPAAELTLVHVIEQENIEAVRGPRAGLLGRAGPPGGTSVEELLVRAEEALLHAARGRLDRHADAPGPRAYRSVRELRLRGRAEREVVAACADADLLVLARDGDHTRLGPRSIGHATRFVLDHAPCRVLLVWPDEGALPPRS